MLVALELSGLSREQVRVLSAPVVTCDCWEPAKKYIVCCVDFYCSVCVPVYHYLPQTIT